MKNLLTPHLRDEVTDSRPEAPVGSQSDGQISRPARTASAGRLFGVPLGSAKS